MRYRLFENASGGFGGLGFHGGDGDMPSANDGAHGLCGIGLGRQGGHQRQEYDGRNSED